jgi:hypothetical protein
MQTVDEALDWLETKNDSTATRQTAVKLLKKGAKGDRRTIDRILDWLERDAGTGATRQTALTLLAALAPGDPNAVRRAVAWAGTRARPLPLRETALRFLARAEPLPGDVGQFLCDLYGDVTVPVKLRAAARDILNERFRGDVEVIGRFVAWLEDPARPEIMRVEAASSLWKLARDGDRATIDALEHLVLSAETPDELHHEARFVLGMLAGRDRAMAGHWIAWLENRENPPRLRHAAVRLLKRDFQANPETLAAFVAVILDPTEEADLRTLAGESLKDAARNDDATAALCRGWLTDPTADPAARAAALDYLRHDERDYENTRRAFLEAIANREQSADFRYRVIAAVPMSRRGEYETIHPEVEDALVRVVGDPTETDGTRELALRRLSYRRKDVGALRDTLRAVIGDTTRAWGFRQAAASFLLERTPEGSEDHAVARVTLNHPPLPKPEKS